MSEPKTYSSQSSGAESVHNNVSVEESHDVSQQQSLNIFDLNYYCLKEILMNVNSDDLVNLAEASPKFEFVAVELYQRLSGNRCLLPTGQNYAFDLKLIRHFSHVIEHLDILAIITFDFRLLDEIVKNFGEHLCTLTIRVCLISLPAWIKNIWATFLNAIHVNFPKLQSLSYDVSSVKCFRNLKCIVRAFPCLIQLSVNLHSWGSLEKIIRLNPQLQYLTIQFIDLKLLPEHIKFIDENMPNLRSLDLRHVQIDEQTEIFERQRFKNLYELSVGCCDNSLGDIFNILAISGDKLESLFCYNKNVTVSTAFQYIFRYNNLKHLHMLYLEDSDLLEISRNLPMLETMSSFGHTVSSSEVHKALQQFSKLTKLTISHQFSCSDHHIEVENQLKGSQWKVTGNDNHFIIQNQKNSNICRK